MSNYNFESIVFKVGRQFFDHCHEAAVAHAQKNPALQVFYVPKKAHAYLVPRTAADTDIVRGPQEYGRRTTSRGVVHTRLKNPLYPSITAKEARCGMDLTPEPRIHSRRKRTLFK